MTLNLFLKMTYKGPLYEANVPLMDQLSLRSAQYITHYMVYSFMTSSLGYLHSRYSLQFTGE